LTPLTKIMRTFLATSRPSYTTRSLVGTAAPSVRNSRLSPFRTVTRLHYLNLNLKHIYSPPSMLLNCPVRQRLRSHGNMALCKSGHNVYYKATVRARVHELQFTSVRFRSRAAVNEPLCPVHTATPDTTKQSGLSVVSGVAV